MAKLEAQLGILTKNLNILLEREAKAAGNAPLSLLNDIEDHHQAMVAVKQAIAGEITETELKEQLAPLNIALNRGSNIIPGNVNASVVAMGKGAQVIINQAKNAVEEAKEQTAYEVSELAQSIARIAQNMQNLVSPFMQNQDSTTSTFSLANRSSLIVNGKVIGSPYKALLDYKISDAPLFYGRRQAIKELRGFLRPGTLTILHAESGAGKSSLLQAGLASRLLAGGHLPMHIRPWNQDPTEAIKRAFLPSLSKTPGLAECSLLDFLHQVGDILGQSTHIYIFLDQFEEFFTQLSPPRQATFIDALAKCLEDESLNVCWLIALRDDFFGKLATFSPRIRHPFQQQYLLRPLEYQEAQEVIVKPAQQVKVTYEDELIPQILYDLTPEEDSVHFLSTPELQLVCAALFESKPADQDVITLAMYQDLGRATGILKNHLRQVLDKKFTPQKRKIAQQVLEALVTSEKRRVLRAKSELSTIIEMEEGTIEDVLAQLLENRLVRISEAGGDDEELAYELAHDYLLGEIELDPETQAHKAAEELFSREFESFKDYGSLLGGTRLDIVLEHQPFLKLNDEQTKFITLSQQARWRRALTRIGLGVVAFIALGILAIISFIGWTQAAISRESAQQAQRKAEAQALASQARQLVDSDTDLSLRFAIAAVTQNITSTYVQNTLRQVLLETRGHEVLLSENNPVFATAWSPDNKVIALGLKNGEIQLWNGMDYTNYTLLTRLTSYTYPVRSLAFSPDGTYLASADASVMPLDFFDSSDGAEGGAHIWDVKRSQEVATLTGHAAGLFNIAWQSAGEYVATASADGTIKVWEAQTWTNVATLTGHSNWVRQVAWSPKTDNIASVGSNGEVFVWTLPTLITQPQTLTATKILTGHQGEVFDVAWHPDGEQIATAGADGLVIIWNTITAKQTDILFGHKSFVRSVAWNPTGKHLASASFGDNKIIIWESDTSRIIVTLAGQRDWIRDITWDASGKYLVSTSDDGSAFVWDVDTIPGISVLEGHLDDPNEVAWHPTQKIVASAGRDNLVYLWGTETKQLLAVLRGHTAPIWSVAWRPDGTQLVTTANDGEIRLWSLPLLTLNDPQAAPLQIDTSANLLQIDTNTVLDAAWLPDGNTLATGGIDGKIRLWDMTKREVVQTFNAGVTSVQEVDFSPDGLQLVAALANSNLVLWDTSQPLTPTHIFTGHTGAVWDVEFSPDGTQLASASLDTTVRVWDIATGEEVDRFSHGRSVPSVAWAPDSSLIASTSDDGITRLWAVSQDSASLPLATLTGHLGGVWNVAWSPDSHQLATAGSDNTIHIFYSDFQTILEIAQQYHPDTENIAEFEQLIQTYNNQ